MNGSSGSKTFTSELSTLPSNAGPAGLGELDYKLNDDFTFTQNSSNLSKEHLRDIRTRLNMLNSSEWVKLKEMLEKQPFSHRNPHITSFYFCLRT